MSLTNVRKAQVRVSKARTNLGDARYKLRVEVQAARQSHTLQEIGDVLGMTKQGVQKLLGKR